MNKCQEENKAHEYINEPFLKGENGQIRINRICQNCLEWDHIYLYNPIDMADLNLINFDSPLYIALIEKKEKILKEENGRFKKDLEELGIEFHSFKIFEDGKWTADVRYQGLIRSIYGYQKTMQSANGALESIEVNSVYPIFKKLDIEVLEYHEHSQAKLGALACIKIERDSQPKIGWIHLEFYGNDDNNVELHIRQSLNNLLSLPQMATKVRDSLSPDSIYPTEFRQKNAQFQVPSIELKNEFKDFLSKTAHYQDIQDIIETWSPDDIKNFKEKKEKDKMNVKWPNKFITGE